MTAYEELACAIVETAIKDYRKLIARIRDNPEDFVAIKECKKVISFFRSDWYKVLTHIDGNFVVDKVWDQVFYKTVN